MNKGIIPFILTIIMDILQIAVLLTVYNRKEKTLNCLNHLYNNSFKGNIDCYMTNDGCTDGTIETVRKYFPNVYIVEGNGELFWNRGMRKAWIEASKKDYDFYLWLNDDTELVENAIEMLIEHSLSKYNKSIIVGSTYHSHNDHTISYGGRKGNRKHTIISPHETKLIKCDTFNGNIVLIPRKVFKLIGYNDSFYRHSFGDIDYGMTATSMGLTNYIAPGFYGYCPRNNPIPIFRRKEKKLISRYKALYSPLGFNPIEDFHLNRKFYSLLFCILWFVKLHINPLFATNNEKNDRW